MKLNEKHVLEIRECEAGNNKIRNSGRSNKGEVKEDGMQKAWEANNSDWSRTSGSRSSKEKKKASHGNYISLACGRDDGITRKKKVILRINFLTWKNLAVHERRHDCTR